MNGRKQGCRQCIRTVQSMNRVIIGLYLWFQRFQRFLRKLSSTNLINILTTTISWLPINLDFGHCIVQ
jgi:hypothetical protein